MSVALDTSSDATTDDGTVAVSYAEYDHGRKASIAGGVIEEGLACISVNGDEIATMMCSPFRLDELGLGFLRSEGIIASLDDVRHLRVTRNACVDVWLNRAFDKPKRLILTAGCGGGLTFDDMSAQHPPQDSTMSVSPAQICELMRQLMIRATIYNRVRGIHTSALCEPDRLVLLAEDVGRHNTIDRLWGQALLKNVDTRERILVSSGRISSEMVTKAAKMGAPIVVSRTSPTSLSVRLAQAWNITLVGYCRGNRFRVYANEHRLSAQA